MGLAARSLATILVVSALSPSSLWGWGANGHRVVGEIAERHLTPTAQGEVQALLGGESLAQVSTWADRIRSRDEWRHADPWHYINAADDESFLEVERNPHGDVLSAIEQQSAVLADPTADRESRANAVRFLTHFVGDLHQPLHAGRASDRGGNDTDVEWFREVENLHWVWDSGLIDHQKLSFTEWVRFLGEPSPREIVDWQSSSVLDWAVESKALRGQVYDFGDRTNDEGLPRLSWRYVDRNLDTVELRLLQGGICLAGLLNHLLDPALASPSPADGDSHHGDSQHDGN